MRTKTLLFPVVLTLAACATTSPEDRKPAMPVEAPDRWAAAEGETAEYDVPDDWWRTFGDPTLSDLVEEAIARNPRLEEAAARVRAAQALATIAGADLYPSVSAGVQGAVQESYTGEGPFTPATQRAERYGVSLNVRWELDVWGRIRSGQAAALADVETQRALYSAAVLSLAAQTAKAYLVAVESHEQLLVAEANLRSAEDLAGRTRERFERGLRRALDVKLAESEVASARSAAHVRRRAHDLSRRQLETLVGRYPAAEVAAAASLPPVPVPVPTGVPADVLSRRPDLVAAERQLAAAGARVKEAEAGLYPRISLTGSGGLTSKEVADVLSGDFGVWSLAAGLTAPIFEGGRLRANVDLRGAREEEAIAAFASAVLLALNEVESALASEGYLDDQGRALETLVTTASDSVVLSEERYLAGLADILGVLEARRRDFNARSALLQTRRERLDARIDLYVALGGGFRRETIVAAKENPDG
jgi:multidrug efflux system outer membrane protein